MENIAETKGTAVPSEILLANVLLNERSGIGGYTTGRCSRVPPLSSVTVARQVKLPEGLSWPLVYCQLPHADWVEFARSNQRTKRARGEDMGGEIIGEETRK